MSLTLQKVEALAPDQASLSAAKKLLANNKWQGQGFNQATTTAWGECQGSGSKPYYVVVDVDDYGYKCSCPSRKFPCKHALALMWRYVNDQSPFAENPAPNWVNDWLGRRRKNSKAPDISEDKSSQKSIDKALDEPQESISAEDALKKQLAAAKRAQKTKLATDASISAGLTELEGWLNDQLRTGMGAFMDKARERTRQIASRLVDAKAAAMASRLDELSALILNQPKHAQIAAAFTEFGRIHLLIQAWQKTPDDPDVRRFIHTTETKEKVLNGPNAQKITGIWQIVGEKIETRKDGLISQATYLARLTDDVNDNNFPFALLLDYHHPSSGFKKSVSQAGSYMAGTLVFYPSRVPFRAFFETVQTIALTPDDAYFDESGSSPVAAADLPKGHYAVCDNHIRQHYANLLTQIPWADCMLYCLSGGQIAKDKNGNYWYQNNEISLPLTNKTLPRIVCACQLSCVFILWQGQRGELLSVVSQEWGFLSCQ